MASEEWTHFLAAAVVSGKDLETLISIANQLDPSELTKFLSTSSKVQGKKTELDTGENFPF